MSKCIPLKVSDQAVCDETFSFAKSFLKRHGGRGAGERKGRSERGDHAEIKSNGFGGNRA